MAPQKAKSRPNGKRAQTSSLEGPEFAADFDQEINKRTAVLVLFSYSSYVAMYLMFGRGFLYAAGAWLAVTLGFDLSVAIRNGRKIPPVFIGTIMRAPLLTPNVNMVGVLQFLLASSPITVGAVAICFYTGVPFLYPWFALYAVAASAGLLLAKPAPVYDLEAAHQAAGTQPGRKTVAVIGGGMAGIATTKECLQNGLDVVLFEKSAFLGGVWAAGGASKRAWGTIYSTSSIFNTQFSDFPMEPFLAKDRATKYPEHFSRQEYCEYLDGYARHFGVDKVAKMSTSIVSVERNGKGWIVASQAEGSEERHVGHFDFVAVTTGLAHQRKVIEYEGLDAFAKANGAASVSHSEAYDGYQQYVGKATAIIGAGETAADIAADIGGHGGTAHVIQRSPTLWLARLMPTLPPDYQEQYFLFLVPRIFRVLRFSVPAYVGTVMSRLVQPPFPGKLPPSGEIGPIDSSWHNGFSRMHLKYAVFHPKSKGWMQSMMQGRQMQVTKAATLCEYLDKSVHIWPHDIKRVTKSGIVLESEQEVKCDSIILAYGYQQKYTFLPEEFHTCVNHDRYMYVFHPELQNVGWIGTVRGGIGSIPMGAEMQARWFALVAAGKRPLPSQEEMRHAVAKHKEAWAAAGNNRWATEVTAVYAHFLARHFVNCAPDMWEIAKKDPLAWLKVFSSTFSPTAFRFSGPYATPDLAFGQYRKAKIDGTLGFVWAMGPLTLASFPLWSLARLLPQSLSQLHPALDSYF